MGDVAASMHGVGSLLKRSIVGSDPKIIVKHMDRYLKEMQWTFNGRGNPHILCDIMSRIVNTVFSLICLSLTYTRVVVEGV